MRKISALFLAAAVLLSAAGCSTLNGVNSAWKGSETKYYSGVFTTGDSQGKYKLTTVPMSATTDFNADQATLNYNITLELTDGQYKTISRGWANAQADYTKSPDGTVRFTNVKLTRADFNDMEPYVYTNMWPTIKSHWAEKLKSGAK
jgi:uncharacterized protein YceK